MKIGLVCDSHVGGGERSPQVAYLLKAVELMKEDGIDTVVCLGDITAFGEYGIFTRCVSYFEDFPSAYILLGNADIRNKEDKEKILSSAKRVLFSAGGRTFLGLHTISSFISKEDIEKVSKLNDGDVVLTHFGIHSLQEESKKALEQILKEKKLTVIHAHSHKRFDYYIGKSRVFGLRALDPDKSIGDYPCITYFDTESEEFTEKVFFTDKEVLKDISSYFGISCANNVRELNYAIENSVKAVELRMSTVLDQTDEILALINTWREKTSGYLSCHMPNLKYDGENIVGVEEWQKAVSDAVRFNANGVTVHPPKIKKNLLQGEVLEKFVDFYVNAFSSFDKEVKIGIENIHKTKAETEAGLPNEELGFGYVPEDILFLVNKINEKFGFDRVGVVLDVGHTKNNGNLSSKYTVGRWYEEVGNKTVAYHIHQVLSVDGGYKNHNAIENWFGPLISYASFFYSWEEGIINKAPVFLEVRGKDNYQNSINAFDNLL